MSVINPPGASSWKLNSPCVYSDNIDGVSRGWIILQTHIIFPTLMCTRACQCVRQVCIRSGWCSLASWISLESRCGSSVFPETSETLDYNVNCLNFANCSLWSNRKFQAATVTLLPVLSAKANPIWTLRYQYCSASFTVFYINV